MGKNLPIIILIFIILNGYSISEAQDKKSDWNNLDSTLSVPGAGIPFVELVIPQKQKVEAERFWNAVKFEREFAESVLNFSATEELNLSEFKLNSTNSLSVFYFLSLTKRGRGFLEKFIPELLNGKVTIVLVPTESYEKYFGAVKAGVPAYYSEGVIYISSQVDLTNILIYFIHEGVHALDLMDADRADKVKIFFKNDIDRNTPEYAAAANILIESEHRAYRAMQVFVDELSDVHPSFSKAIQILKENRTLHHYPTNSEEFTLEMARGYYIPTYLLSEYFKTRDWKCFN